MQNVIRECFDTTITRKFDVVVTGGGPAGCCAAIAAARNGAKTLLIEREGYLGGMLTGGMVGSSGIYTVSPSSLEQYSRMRHSLKENPDSSQLIRGIPREIMRRLISTGGGIGYFGEVPAYVCVHVPSFKRLLMSMMEENGVELLFYAQGIKPILEQNKVKGVVIQGKGCREAIEAKVVIDATGDGDIAAAAGAQYNFGREIDNEAINMTLMFTVGGIDMEKYFREEVGEGSTWPPSSRADHVSDMRQGNSYWMSSSKKLSERPQVSQKLREQIDNFVWSTNHTRGHIFACNSPVRDELYINVTEVYKKSGLSSWEITQAIKTSYKQVELLYEMYKAAVPGFENSYIREIAPLLGIRETRRIIGNYIVTGDDVRASRKFSDGIAGSAHPIDTSEDNKGKFELLESGKYFEVPYRCIQVKGIGGILTAGRCISSDHDALGAIRPTAPCMALGEAAGTAAAMAVEMGVDPLHLDGVAVRQRIGWDTSELKDFSGEMADLVVGAAPTLQRSNG